MIGEYGINGKDCYSVFGLTLIYGLNELLTFPERKDPAVSHDWPEQNGIDIDLSDPEFKARDITLKFLMVGTDDVDFSNKYTALFNEFKKPGSFRFYADVLAKNYNIYYKKASEVVVQTKMRAGQVGVSFTLTVSEPQPNPNSIIQAISPGLNKFLVNENGQYIIV